MRAYFKFVRTFWSAGRVTPGICYRYCYNENYWVIVKATSFSRGPTLDKPYAVFDGVVVGSDGRYQPGEHHVWCDYGMPLWRQYGNP